MGGGLSAGVQTVSLCSGIPTFKPFEYRNAMSHEPSHPYGYRLMRGSTRQQGEQFSRESRGCHAPSSAWCESGLRVREVSLEKALLTPAVIPR